MSDYITTLNEAMVALEEEMNQKLDWAINSHWSDSVIIDSRSLSIILGYITVVHEYIDRDIHLEIHNKMEALIQALDNPDSLQ